MQAQKARKIIENTIIRSMRLHTDYVTNDSPYKKHRNKYPADRFDRFRILTESIPNIPIHPVPEQKEQERQKAENRSIVMKCCNKIKLHDAEQHPCDSAPGAFESGDKMKQAGDSDTCFGEKDSISAAAQKYSCADDTDSFNAIAHQPCAATLFSSNWIRQ